MRTNENELLIPARDFDVIASGLLTSSNRNYLQVSSRRVASPYLFLLPPPSLFSLPLPLPLSHLPIFSPALLPPCAPASRLSLAVPSRYTRQLTPGHSTWRSTRRHDIMCLLVSPAVFGPFVHRWLTRRVQRAYS